MPTSRIARRELSIAIVTPLVTYGHGQGRVNLEIAREALRRGHRVTLVAGQIDPGLAAHPRVTAHEIRFDGVPSQLLRGVLFDLGARRIVASLRGSSDIIATDGAAMTARADVNAAHFVHSAFLASRSPSRRLSASPRQLYQLVYSQVNAFLERHAFRQARTLVAVSRRVAEELIAIGVDPEAIRIIHNGVDLEEFSPGPQSRAALGLPDGVPVALFVGDLRVTRKNLDTVLKALLIDRQLHVAVVGTVEHSPYPEMAARLGVADRVHFLGFRRDVGVVMRAADLFVFPTRYEPFGMVVLEALASGLPVIVSAAAGVSEVVEAGCGVVLEDPEDAPGIAAAVAHILGDKATLAAMRAQARAVAERHGWEVTARAYLDHFEELARSGR